MDFLCLIMVILEHSCPSRLDSKTYSDPVLYQDQCLCRIVDKQTVKVDLFVHSSGHFRIF